MRWKRGEVPLENMSNHQEPLPAHPVMCLLYHSLIKEGTLGQMVTNLSSFSGEMANVEISLEQCYYELQTFRKTYGNSALREGLQMSLQDADADTVATLVLKSLDSIIDVYHYLWQYQLF